MRQWRRADLRTHGDHAQTALASRQEEKSPERRLKETLASKDQTIIALLKQVKALQKQVEELQAKGERK